MSVSELKERWGQAYGLVDPELERLAVAALALTPSLYSEWPLELGCGEIMDPLAREVFEAIANLSALGLEIGPDSIVAQIENQNGVNTEAANQAAKWLSHASLKSGSESSESASAIRESFLNKTSALVKLAQVRARAVAEDAPEPERTTYWRAPQLTSEILREAADGFVAFTLGGAELYRLPYGGSATLTAAPGAGKTTFALAIALEHARRGWYVVFLSLEMSAVEAAARLIGMQLGASWEDVLTGKIPRDMMDECLDMKQFVILDGDNATVSNMCKAIEDMRHEMADQPKPILTVTDYIQIMPANKDSPRDLRARLAAAVQELRRVKKAYRVLGLDISQPSRAAGKALSSGELLGVDSMSAMAETAEIERSAYVTLALSPNQEEQGKMDLSIGKSRMGKGDVVVPLEMDGATGRIRIIGETKPASEVRNLRKQSRDVDRVRDRVLRCIAKSPNPLTREEIRTDLGINRTALWSAIKVLLAEGEIDGTESYSGPNGGRPSTRYSIPKSTCDE